MKKLLVLILSLVLMFTIFPRSLNAKATIGNNLYAYIGDDDINTDSSNSDSADQSDITDPSEDTNSTDNAEEQPKIVSIAVTTINVPLNTSAYSMPYYVPTTVAAKMEDGTTQQVDVVWTSISGPEEQYGVLPDASSYGGSKGGLYIDPSKTGRFSIEGKVEGYNKVVLMNINVVSSSDHMKTYVGGNNTTYYYYENSNIQNDMILFYITRIKNSTPQLHIRIRYVSDNDWMFLNGYTFNVDGKKYSSGNIYSKVVRDAKGQIYSSGLIGINENTYAGALVGEQYDIVLDSKKLTQFKAIMNSKKASIIISGKSKNYQIALDSKFKTGMKYLQKKFDSLKKSKSK